MSNLYEEPKNIPSVGSLAELKQLVTQFEAFIPQDKRAVIQSILAELEATNGVQNEAQGQRMLAQLMQALGLSGR